MFAGTARWLWLVTLMLAGGCAARLPVAAPEAEPAWLEHRAALEALRDWQVQGRVALSTDNEGWNASFDWRQRGDKYRIRLRGPFGQGAMELLGGQTGVWLKRANQPAVFAQNPDVLLQQQTGWQLPVTGLGAWLRGLPVTGGDPVIQWDAQGRLLHIGQNGWLIDYQRYLVRGDLSLPEKLSLKRDSVQVRFVVDSWQIP